jgi:hypothetical protein
MLLMSRWQTVAAWARRPDGTQAFACAATKALQDNPTDKQQGNQELPCVEVFF